MQKLLKTVWVAWKKAALKLARFQTNLLLTLFYTVIISPLGLLFRSFGWDPLESRKRHLRKPSNWKAVDHGEPDLQVMRRQS